MMLYDFGKVMNAVVPQLLQNLLQHICRVIKGQFNKCKNAPVKDDIAKRAAGVIGDRAAQIRAVDMQLLCELPERDCFSIWVETQRMR